MAYAAGLGLAERAYLDTGRDGGVVAHPLFPVSPEWALFTSGDPALDVGSTPVETLRGVHAQHELVLARAVRQDDVVALQATVAGVEATRAGARVTTRFDACDPAGAPVWTSWFVVVLRGVDVEGPDVAPGCRPEPLTFAELGGDPDTALDRRLVGISALDGHVYTECAAIWNPIHTDVAVAHAAGLPGPILHGTATLAHGVSSVLAMLDEEPGRVRRVAGTFRAIVPMPSTLAVELLAVGETAGGRTAAFRVVTESRDRAVDGGRVVVERTP